MSNYGEREVFYRCRDIGYGVEEGTARGVWGGYDWAGKRMLARTDGGPTLYLFDDEVIDDAAISKAEGRNEG